MKTIISKSSIFLYTVLLSSFTYAQTEEAFNPTQKGQFLIGANSSFGAGAYSNKSTSDNQKDIDGSDVFSISLAPQFGYFIIDNLVAGLEFNAGYSTSKDESVQDFENKNSTTSIIVSPFVTYYFGKNNIKPFVNASVGFGSAKNKSENSNFDELTETTSKSTVFNYALRGGVAVFLNDKISLDLGLGYNRRTNKEKEDNPNNIKNINNSLRLNAGFSLFF